MELNKHFVKYYSKLRAESIVKSLIWGLVVGCSLGFVMALTAWFVNFKDFWGTILSGIVAVVCSAAAVPVFYFKVFKPNSVTSARRLDRYGLDERLITMIELENDQSYLAQLQREDAAKVLNTVAISDIKMRIPQKFIITVCICGVIFAGMTTVTGLAEAGIIQTGSEILETIIPEPKITTFEVMYMVGEGGYISGDDLQVVEQGKSTDPVVAVAEDGYVFYCWSDGRDKPTRAEGNVQADVVYEAIFAPLGEGEGEGQGDGDPGDKPSDKKSQMSGQGQSDDQGKPGGEGAGGKSEAHNQVINGQTWYQDEMGTAYDDFVNDPTLGDLPENYQGISGGYFELMGSGSKEEGDSEGSGDLFP